MRITTERVEILIDLVRTLEDIGEVVKLGASLGFESIVERVPQGESDPHELYFRVRLTRANREWGETEIVNLAVLASYVYDRSGNQQLGQLESALTRIGMPMDRPLQDVVNIKPTDPSAALDDLGD